MGRILTFESWESSRLEESSNVEVADPVTPSEVVPDVVTPTTVETNKEILDKLKTSGILGVNIENLPGPENKLFLPSVLTLLNDKEIKPILFVPHSGQQDRVQLSIPESNILFDLKKNYFGTDIVLPKGIHLKLGYRNMVSGSKKSPFIPKVEPFSPSNLRFGIQIPIGT